MRNFTDITFILDRSGSMQPLVKDVVGGYTAFVQEQQQKGDNASLTLVQFADNTHVSFAGVPIRDVTMALDFYPNGSTALLDALGETIIDTGTRLAALPESERPDKVLLVVFTDGEENTSRIFTYARVKALVEQQQTVYNWTFLFLGANIDAAAESQRLGIPMQYAVTYDASNIGTVSSFGAVGTYTTMMREQNIEMLKTTTLTSAYADALDKTQSGGTSTL
jgi:hypothetical protein